MTNASKTRAVVLAAGLALAGGVAMAQSAGTWMVKIGVNNIEPHVKSGDLSAPSLPGSKIDVKGDTSLIATAIYMVTDDISVELYGGLGYKHEVVGAGAISNVGKLGTVKQVAPTIFGQYRFLGASSALRPYVGLGLTYAYFYGERGSGALTATTNPGGTPTRSSVESAWGLSPQAGVSYFLTSRWFVDGSVTKTFLKSKTTLSTGQSVDTRLDPVAVNLSVGYKF